MYYGPFPRSAYSRAYDKMGDYLKQWAADAASFRRAAKSEPEHAEYWTNHADELDSAIMNVIREHA